MELSAAQLDRFHQDGFLILPELFTAEEVAVLRGRLSTLFAEEADANIREKHSGDVRTAMGLHLRDEVYDRLVRHPRLIGPGRQIAGSDVYIQQVKVNVKPAFHGESWQWHYDFATHYHEDGVPKPLAINLHIFLDDVNDFNGPLYFIAGSHKRGAAPTHLDDQTTSYPLWVVDPDTVSGLVSDGRLVSAKGAAGTVLVFCDTLVHGSPPNMSPWDRRIFSLIVNPVSNALTKTQRPDYKHHRDLTPVMPLEDDCLMSPRLETGDEHAAGR